MELDGPAPRIHTSALRERIAAILATGCGAWDGTIHPSARFTRRLVAGNWTVHLQCTGCGRSLGGSLRRADIHNWQDFPLWDDSFEKARDERAREWLANRPTREQLEAEREAEYARQQAGFAAKRAAYARWLLTSHEWRILRDRVLRRASGRCEACLANTAGDVHHLTYTLGKLPPAWELRAVCRECHDRIHAGWGKDDEVTG